jgi:hypothetical protein
MNKEGFSDRLIFFRMQGPCGPQRRAAEVEQRRSGSAPISGESTATETLLSAHRAPRAGPYPIDGDWHSLTRCPMTGITPASQPGATPRISIDSKRCYRSQFEQIDPAPPAILFVVD